MEGFDTWILPFTFIPGVGMLVLSTANRFHIINGLIRKMVAEKPGEHGQREQSERYKRTLAVLLKRSQHFQRALVSFYLAICLFAISALGSISVHWIPLTIGTYYLSDITILLGVICMVYGSIRMVLESLLAFDMIRTLHDSATSTLQMFGGSRKDP